MLINCLGERMFELKGTLHLTPTGGMDARPLSRGEERIQT